MTYDTDRIRATRRRKGQVAAMPANNMPAQATFIANLFGVAA